MVTLLCVLQSDRHHIPWLGCPFGSGLVYVEIKLGVTSSISFSVNIALTPRPHGPSFRLKTRETFYFVSPAMSPRERPLTFAAPTPAPPPPRATALWASSLLAPDAAAAVPASKERSWKRTASLLLLVLVLCWALYRQNGWIGSRKQQKFGQFFVLLQLIRKLTYQLYNNQKLPNFVLFHSLATNEVTSPFTAVEN